MAHRTTTEKVCTVFCEQVHARQTGENIREVYDKKFLICQSLLQITVQRKEQRDRRTG